MAAPASPLRDEEPTRGLAFRVERGSTALTFAFVALSVIVPISLLGGLLSFKAGLSTTQTVEILLVSPPIALFFAWTQATSPVREVSGDSAEVVLTSQNKAIHRIPWDNFRGPTVIGFPLWQVRFPATGLSTLYGVIFTTYDQARAVLAHPSFPASYKADEARARLGTWAREPQKGQIPSWR